jgi:hypothetical protein
MLLLNDVPTHQRLAYILGPTLDRSQRRDNSRKAVTMALLGAAMLLLAFLWHVTSSTGYR